MTGSTTRPQCSSPRGSARGGAESVTLYETPDITIQVALLLTECNVTDVTEAEEVLADFFPADELTPRRYELVAEALTSGLPLIRKPEFPDFR